MDLHLMRSRKSRDVGKGEKGQEQNRSRSQNIKHPIVKIFDIESSRIMKGYKKEHVVDLVETQPYIVYNERV